MGLICQYAKIYKKNFTTKKTIFLFDASLSMTLNQRKRRFETLTQERKKAGDKQHSTRGCLSPALLCFLEI